MEPQPIWARGADVGLSLVGCPFPGSAGPWTSSSWPPSTPLAADSAWPVSLQILGHCQAPPVLLLRADPGLGRSPGEVPPGPQPHFTPTPQATELLQTGDSYYHTNGPLVAQCPQGLRAGGWTASHPHPLLRLGTVPGSCPSVEMGFRDICCVFSLPELLASRPWHPARPLSFGFPQGPPARGIYVRLTLLRFER